MKKTIQICAFLAVSTFLSVPIIAQDGSREKPDVSPTVYKSNNKTINAVFAHNIPMNMLPVSAKTNRVNGIQNSMPEPNPPVFVKGIVNSTETKSVNSSIAKSAGVLSPTAQTKYSHGDPTDGEQYILELINRARADPKAEGIRIANTTDPGVVQGFTGIDKNQFKAAFAGYPQRPPLAFNANIITAARGHSNWMVQTGIQDHNEGNITPFDRMNSAGYTGWSLAGENIFKDAYNLWMGHAAFQVDWGTENQQTLGHRRNIMNFDGGIYREIGIGITPNNGRFAITEDFGNRGINFIVGVVYKDNNNNGFYDPGEGLSGVTITPSKGTYYAVTSTSGGYAIPVQGVTGSVTVEASGGELGATVTKNISLQSDNVKVDFTSPLPGQVSLASPLPGTVLSTQSISFTWYKSPGNISGYAFELADNDAFFNPIVSNQDLTDTTITVPDLSNGTTYYWHVRAKTNAGWGDYTEANDFSIKIIPAIVEIITTHEPVIHTDSLRVVWRKGDSSVTKYWIEITNLDNFETIIDSNLTDTSYIFRNLKFETSYSWHIAAKNSELWGDFTEDMEFMPLQLPQQVQLAYPVDNYTTKNPKITFGWFQKDPISIESYWFEIATDAEMKNIFLVDSTTTDTFKVLISLKPGVQYYWHVRQSNIAGWGDFSPTRLVMITTTGVDDDFLASKFHANAVPNPANNSDVMISFELPQSTHVSLTIVNSIGQTVSTLTDAMLESGDHKFIWNAKQIESGMYFYRLKAGNEVMTLPIVVVK
ncbi:MAG: T9SS type A sorting domain-containing protein [Ignavibacteriae bacterium]|nr:T9SS type A sorting domain-containing protein [Ignavibacteriota bacterium]